MELAPLVPRRESASRRSAWAALLTLASAALLLASAGVGRRPALAVAPSLRAAEADAAEADAAEAEAPLALAVGNEYGWWHNRMYPWRFVVEPHRTTDLEVRNLAAGRALDFALRHAAGTGVAAARDGARNAARSIDAFTLIDTNASAGRARAIFRLAAGEYAVFRREAHQLCLHFPLICLSGGG